MAAVKSWNKMPSWASEVEEEHRLTGWDATSSHSEERWQQNFQHVATSVSKNPSKNKKSKKKGKAAAPQNDHMPSPKQFEYNVCAQPFVPKMGTNTQAPPDYGSAWELQARGRGTGKDGQIRQQLEISHNSPVTNGKPSPDGWSTDFPALPVQSSKPAQVLGASCWEPKQHQPPPAFIQSNRGNSGSQLDNLNNNLPGSSNSNANSIIDALLPIENVGLSEGSKIGRRANLSNSGPTTRSVDIVPPVFLDVFSSGDMRANSNEHLDSEDEDMDSDSDWVSGEDFDSDASAKRHETLKGNKAHRVFFQTLDEIRQDDLDNEGRQWHCPICKGGPGAIDWYCGFKPLLTHAKTVKKKVQQHRTFHKVLETELARRRADGPSGMLGMWKGLKGDDEDYNPLIIWPPMVVIQNTKLELDPEDKWIGMGNKELQDSFKEWNFIKTKHSYGPKGHTGMSMLIFAESPAGYYEALRLDQRFRDNNRGRESWDKPSKFLFDHGGQRILYGYLAVEEDLKIFNRHSKGKTALKWDLRRHREVVVEPLRNMDEETQQLHKLKYKVEREKEISKNLEKTLTNTLRKLRLREEEVIVLNERALEQTNDNQTQMDDLELHQRHLEDVISNLHQKLEIQENEIKAMQDKSVEQLNRNREEIEALEQSHKWKISQLKSGICEKEQAMQKVQERFQEESFQRYQELQQQHSTLCHNMGHSEGTEQKRQAKLEAMSWESQKIEISLKDVKEYEAAKMQLENEHHARRLDFKRKQLEEEMAFQQKLEAEKLDLLESWKQKKFQEGIC